MLKYMRKYATGYLIKALFGIIIIVFIFWGVGSFKEGDRVVAKVGPYTVTAMEYHETYERLMNFYRTLYKDRLDDDVMKELKIKEKTMDELVDKYAMLIEAKRLGLRVTHQEFSEYINGIKAFHRDGKFDPKVYVEMLKRNKMDPNKFEESEKGRMLMAKLLVFINDNSVFMDETHAWESYTKERGKVNLSYGRYDPAAFKDMVTVTDREAEEAYEKEKDSLRGEDQYQFKYITIDEKSAIKDDDVYMELLKVKDISVYGKQNGFEVTDTGMMKESEFIKRFKSVRAGEWLKGLRKGDVSLPAREGSMSYIFQVVEIEPGKSAEKGVALNGIRERIARNKAESFAKARAEEDIIKKKMSFKGETGMIPRSSAAIPGIGPLPQGFNDVLSLSKDRPVYDKPVVISNIYYVFSFKDERLPDREDWEKEKQSYMNYLSSKKKEENFKLLMDEIKKREKIKIFWNEV